jgi:hypothetical protein
MDTPDLSSHVVVLVAKHGASGDLLYRTDGGFVPDAALLRQGEAVMLINVCIHI